MLSKTTLLPLATMLAVAAAAPAAPTCDGWYLVEKWGKVVAQPSWTGFGEFRGCQSEEIRLAKRAKYDTVVEPGNNNVETAYVADTSTVQPYTFFWDHVGDLCGDTYCDGDKSYTESDGKLAFSLDGNFASVDLRNDFVTLIQTALYKTVHNDTSTGVNFSKFANFIHATTTYGDASGYFLTMRITQPLDNPGCPTFVSDLGDLGSLLPGLGSVFGLIGAACSTAG